MESSYRIPFWLFPGNNFTVIDTDIQQHQQKLSDAVGDMLATASEFGASQAEASANFGSGLSVTVRKQAVETLEFNRDTSMTVTVYFGHRKGSASTSDLSSESCRETVTKACSLAKYGAEDEFAGLADPERMATEFPDLDLYHPWNIDAEAAIDIATQCEAAALQADERINNSEGATVSSYAGCGVYGNSHGFLAGFPNSQHSLSCAVLAGQGSEMQRDDEYTVARDPADLDPAAKIGALAADKTLQRLGARKLDTRVTPVIYPADLARGLFGHAVSALSGGALYREASFLLNKLDEQIFAPHITVVEQPHLPKAMGSTSFDGEGVATRSRDLIAAGVLKGYVLASYYARKLGLESTANAGGVHNLLVSDTGHSKTDLLQQMGTGFLVTELMGQGVNNVTGDYSRGAAGFWVENGEIAYPVHEVTLAGNLLEIYKDISAIATDVDRRGGIQSGSLLVDKLTVAGS
jgi:PmbA protein